jgi:signal transduction histidine kinase/CheY-like chemotaxis protein
LKPELSERALILAPGGRDADVAAAMLAESRIPGIVCRTLAALLTEVEVGAGCGIVAEEALASADLHPLNRWLEAQAEWSDFPFILLTHRGGGLEKNPAAGRYLGALGNVTFLERPFHPTTLVSLARSALRGRRRQYEARARLEALHHLAGSLERQVEERTAELRNREARLRAIFEGNYQYQGLMTPEGILLDVARVATGEAIRQEMRINLPIGWRSFDFGMRPMHDEQGKVVAIVPEAVDITDRRNAEEALLQSQKLEAMGQLTGGVAHDFNNLLTPIIGSLDLLHRRGLGDARERRLIEGALQSADRAKTLVQRLLAFARRQPLQPRPVDVAALVTDMGNLVASTTGPQIKVVVDAPRNLPRARADPNQLEMALLNLSVNARDAMSDGGTLRITVSSEILGSLHRASLPAGEYIRLSVADSGVGMDDATLARAVEPFFSTKGVGKGTGLGLSMVHGLASQLGGALTLSSRPGVGTNIDLWLPVTDGREDVEAAILTPAEAAHSGTVLLVDDEPLVRASTAHMLSELGYRVVEAVSADEALVLLDGADFDLLVTDHLMPGMSGADLTHEVRIRRPTLPVLIISGYAEEDGIAPELPRLTKPFRQLELAAKIAALIAMAPLDATPDEVEPA